MGTSKSVLFSPKISFKILLSVILSIYFATDVVFSKENYTVCTTQECVDLGLQLMYQLEDDSVVCNDFYKFVCNKWHFFNPSQSKIWWDQFTKTEQKLHTYLKEILEKQGSNDTSMLAAAKEYHHLCMDTEKIEEQGVQPIIDLLSSRDGWPMLQPTKTWEEKFMSWKESEKLYSEITSKSSFFNVDFVVRNGIIVLSLNKPDFLVPLETLASDNSTAFHQKHAYRQMMKNIMTEIIAPKSLKEVRALAQAVTGVLDLEIKLAKIITNPENKRIPEVTSVGDFQRYYENELKFSAYWEARGLPVPDSQAQKCLYKLNWVDELRSVMGVKDPLLLHDYTPLAISTSFYFADLCELLEQTPDTVIKNFIFWHLIQNLLPRLEGKFQDIFYKAANVIDFNGYSTSSYDNRFDRCFKENKMTDAIYHELLQTYFPNERDDQILDVVKNVDLETLREFSRPFNTLYSPAMDYNVKYKASEYFMNFNPEFSASNKILQNSYIMQVFAHERYAIRSNLPKLLQAKDEDTTDKWLGTPWSARIRSKLMWKDNSLEIPAMSLQPPFYGEDLPLSYVYGAFGVQIAQRMSEFLNRYHAAIWGMHNPTNHEKVVGCYRNQRWGGYTNVYEILRTAYDTPPGVQQDPKSKHLWSHKIQDALGLKVAFRAYQRRVRREGKQNLRLPRLEKYNDEQLFFIGFANAFCEVPVASLTHQAPWYPDRIYVNADMVDMAIMNNEDFGRVFNCPTETPMNPQKKCNYWYVNSARY